MSHSVVLDLSHKRGNPRNSEGAFVTLADGRILFVYTHYYGESWGDDATARLCSRVSSDGGHTWSRRDAVVVENEGRCNVMSVSLLRLRDGRIGLWYLRKNGIGDCRAWLRTSSDEAQTWSRPTLCIPAPGYFCVNNDRVIQLSGGRLVIPAAFHRNKLPPHGPKGKSHAALDFRAIAVFFLSDDAGRTWRESRDWRALPVRSGSGMQEPGAVELSDGRLYAWCRTDVGCQYEMGSEDRGDTWSAPRPSPFLAPCSPLCIKRIPATGELLAVWNDHSGRLVPVPRKQKGGGCWDRTPLVAAISPDDGRSWSRGWRIESDPTRAFCYTAVHFTDDAVLLAYCCGGGEGWGLRDLRIRRVSLDWLREGGYGPTRGTHDA